MTDAIPSPAKVAKKAVDDKPMPPPGEGDNPIIRALTGRAAPMHILMAELLAGALLVGIRAAADYEVSTTGTVQGKVGHPQGQLGPFPILAALITCFFLLSFLAVGASGGKARAKVAVAIGALLDIGLAMRSVTQIEKVAGVFGGSFGTAGPAPQPAPTSIVTQAPVGSTSPKIGGGSGSSSSGGSKAPQTKTGEWGKIIRTKVCWTVPSGIPFVGGHKFCV